MAREMVLNALVVFLLAVILFMCWLHACGRWRQWRSTEETEENVFADDDQPQIPMKTVQRKGLDKAMIDSLPTFTYSSNDQLENLQGSADNKYEDKEDKRSGAASPSTFIYSSINDQFQVLQESVDDHEYEGEERSGAACSRKTCSIECPVCLCEFQHKEKGRVLPNCRHRFHVDCIDTWLLSSATCPVCRASCADERAATEDFVPLQVITSPTGMTSTTRNDQMSAALGIQYPTNVLFWGNNSLVSSRTSLDAATQQSTPAASTIIQIYTVEVQPLHVAPSLSSSSPPASITHVPSPSSRITKLNSLRRLLSRERRHNDPNISNSGYIAGSSKA